MNAILRPRAGRSGAQAMLVLLVGCPAEFVAACQEAGGRVAVATRECDLASACTVARTTRPFVIVVMEEVYHEGPFELDELARDAGTPLIRIDRADMRNADCQRYLAQAIAESAVVGDMGSTPVC